MLLLLAASVMTPKTAPDLSWMAGKWTGAVWGGRMEEHWMTQEGGTMLAMNRVVKDGKTVHKEFIWIETTRESTTLSVTLFRTPPEVVPFTLTKFERNLAVFTNPSHERLSSMTYRRNGKQMLITLEGTRKEQPYREEIKLERE